MLHIHQVLTEREQSSPQLLFVRLFDPYKISQMGVREFIFVSVREHTNS